MMKKIDTSKSVVFSRGVEDLKKSLEYLNQYGYFSNSKDFSEYEEAKLSMVRVANFVWYPYDSTYECDGDSHVFSYFIPKSKAVFVEEEPKEKKYRPLKTLVNLALRLVEEL